MDDVLLDRLLAKLEEVPLAKELLLGGSVYRIPVDFLGLAWQVGEEIEIPEDRERGERIAAMNREIGRARAQGEEPSPELLARFQAEMPEWLRSPLALPKGFAEAMEVLGVFGLLAPVQWSGATEDARFAVHRWTASAMLRRGMEAAVQQAHQRAARYWRWRAERLPQSRQEDIAQFLEARYHYREAGDIDQAVKVTEGICLQLDTWGAYRREEQLCREVLRWLPERSSQTAAFLHQIGTICQKRGDYDQALDWYKRSLQIKEELGNRAGMANSYHQLGMVSQNRGDYDQALDWYKRSLQIKEELGNRADMASSYHQLGRVAELRGDLDQALDWYKRSLQINEELDNRAGMASSYHQLGMVAQVRGGYDQALAWYKRSLQIEEELGNRAGMASSYHQLGMVSQERGDLDQALYWYKRSLQIDEELGNRAGMAISYHQLGNVAYLRGVYDHALDWYKRSLQIFEELGNRADMASSISQLGALATEQGRPEDAVPLNLQSLVIRLELRVPEVGIDLHWLSRQRELLGEERFGELLREHVGDEGAEAVLGLMAQAAAGDEAGEGTPP